MVMVIALKTAQAWETPASVDRIQAEQLTTMGIMFGAMSCYVFPV
jgi:hypothetical protein